MEKQQVSICVYTVREYISLYATSKGPKDPLLLRRGRCLEFYPTQSTATPWSCPLASVPVACRTTYLRYLLPAAYPLFGITTSISQNTLPQAGRSHSPSTNCSACMDHLFCSYGVLLQTCCEVTLPFSPVAFHPCAPTLSYNIPNCIHFLPVLKAPEHLLAPVLTSLPPAPPTSTPSPVLFHLGLLLLLQPPAPGPAAAPSS